MNEPRIAELREKIASKEAVFDQYVQQNRFPNKVARRKEELEAMKAELAKLEAKKV